MPHAECLSVYLGCSYGTWYEDMDNDKWQNNCNMPYCYWYDSPSNLEGLKKLNSILDDVSDPSLVLMRCTKLLQNRYGINDSTGMALILNPL